MMDTKSPISANVLEAVEHLNYDFRQFEIAHFLNHVASYRQRQINCQGMDFQDRNLFGLWLRGDTVDYIFYSIHTYSVHRTHIILHEVGHMLLWHTALTSEQAMELLAGVPLEQIAAELDEGNPAPLVLPRGFHRHFIRADQQEIEAEDFGTYIQSQIIQANRLKYLIAASSSIENLRSFTDGLGFQE